MTKTITRAATFALVLTAVSTTGCSALGAICAGWLATPCIICVNENSSAAVDQSLERAPELPMTLSATSTTTTTSPPMSMSY